MEYVTGACRNEPDATRAHLYADTDEGLFPMCGYGWNRSDGTSLSILRGHGSRRGTCRLCKKNAEQGRPPVKNGWPHKTKWL